MIKILNIMDTMEFSCPLCHSGIERHIKENVVIKINTKGDAVSHDNEFYEDDFVCAKCGIELTDIVKHDPHKGWILYSRGCDLLKKNKNIDKLADNPFAKKEV